MTSLTLSNSADSSGDGDTLLLLPNLWISPFSVLIKYKNLKEPFDSLLRSTLTINSVSNYGIGIKTVPWPLSGSQQSILDRPRQEHKPRSSKELKLVFFAVCSLIPVSQAPVSPAPQASPPGCCSCAWVAPGGTRAPGRRGRGRCTKAPASHRRAQGRCRRVQGQNRRGLQGRSMKELLVLCRTRRRKSLQKGLSLRQRRRGSQSCRRRDVASPLQIGMRTTIDALWVTKTWQKFITKTSFQIPTLGLIVSCQNWNTLAVEAMVVSERRSKETCVKNMSEESYLSPFAMFR